MTNFQIDVPSDNLSRILITFDILEENDGAAIQIIYAGNEFDPHLKCDATVIGAKSLYLVTMSPTESDKPWYLNRGKFAAVYILTFHLG